MELNPPIAGQVPTACRGRKWSVQLDIPDSCDGVIHSLPSDEQAIK